MTQEDIAAQNKHPFGSPTWEYMTFKGYDKVREVDAVSDVSNHDILMAILRSADTIHHELTCIRKSLESR